MPSPDRLKKSLGTAEPLELFTRPHEGTWLRLSLAKVSFVDEVARFASIETYGCIGLIAVVAEVFAVIAICNDI